MGGYTAPSLTGTRMGRTAELGLGPQARLLLEPLHWGGYSELAPRPEAHIQLVSHLKSIIFSKLIPVHQ